MVSERRAAGVAAPYSRFAEVYDRLVGDMMFPAIAASFEQDLAGQGVSFRSVADLGCGTGTFLEYLLRFRVPLWGVDASRAMLKEAARRLPPGRVRLLHQDMRRLRLPQPVDLITCNGDTLNYLLDAAALGRALCRCARALNPGGHLSADLLVGRPRGAGLDRRRSIETHLGPTLWRARASPERRLTRVDILWPRRSPAGWRWTRETHHQRWHRATDLIRGLRMAGLTPVSLRRVQPEFDAGSGAWIKLLACRH